MLIPEPLDKALRQRIPDELIQMMDHAKDIDAFRYIVINQLATANRELVEAEKSNQLIKSPKVTEADRKQYCEFRTREQKEMVELLSGTLSAIDKRINLIQTLMKSETEVYKRA